ncbi:3-isopropylmalate dehydratase small subunit [Amycolatopsis antarctica]|uniref:3-isopropylmalate dehydratase small subunit n=1 Tax=Amycolatopsis antarctica TaxID=1854586 RepID=A0A263D5W1_9PSEU|nr:3-isopropylmalate dehydratase small subunit [Amycolatopsis antarctica]OZM73579.1 3-isopropylmalate dehydratase small subunit [Amycolatopsis antarctica]
MEPLIQHTGRAIALRRGDVDTDQIIPAEFCKRLTKSGYEDTLFVTWREDPEFPLNDPRRAGASVLIGAHNFGTGSSREHAVWALRDWGFAVVVASSFGDIFRRNAFKNGLLAVELPEEVVAELADRADADPAFEITVDLDSRELRADGLRHGFEVDRRARRLLLEGLDDIAVTLGKDGLIADYERARHSWLPRLAPTDPIPSGNLRLAAN